MNDAIYHDINKREDVLTFEKEHPSAIDTAIAFCKELMKYKTIQPKTIQGILGCTEAESLLFIEQLIIGEMLEKLDIDDTYFVMKDAVNGLIILFQEKLFLIEFLQRKQSQ
jgi:hypothetical protein